MDRIDAQLERLGEKVQEVTNATLAPTELARSHDRRLTRLAGGENPPPAN